MADLGPTGKPKFPQRVTFIATLDIVTEDMDWFAAQKNINQALLDGDGGDVPYTLTIQKVIRMEIPEEEE